MRMVGLNYCGTTHSLCIARCVYRLTRNGSEPLQVGIARTESSVTLSLSLSIFGPFAWITFLKSLFELLAENDQESKRRFNWWFLVPEKIGDLYLVLLQR